MMESTDEVSSHHGGENKGTYFLDDSWNKNIPRKQKHGCLMKHPLWPALGNKCS